MCTVTKESLVSTCVWECANTSETHASRFGVPNRRRYRLTVGHRPRSAVVRHRCRKGIARERRVDRYYDPATDQFLSVDPDVAETGQPYAFTNDDPVNESDPLGNHGGCTTSYCGPNSGTIVTSTGEYCSTNCGGSPTTTNLGDGATAVLPAPSSSLTFLTFLSTQPSSVVDYFECQNGDQSACKAIAPVPTSPSVSSVQQMLNIAQQYEGGPLEGNQYLDNPNAAVICRASEGSISFGILGAGGKLLQNYGMQAMEGGEEEAPPTDGLSYLISGLGALIYGLGILGIIGASGAGPGNFCP